jgi:TatD DNase family protein
MKFVNHKEALDRFAALATAPKIVAVGECGLDYFYEHSPREEQIKILEFQLVLAKRHNLPLIFHVREAFDDFWSVVDNFEGIRGVLHSFTDNHDNMLKAVRKGLYIGVNGISTFTKNPEQLEMYKSIPLENLLLETDAPFLTPVPLRGTICEPKHVVLTAEFLSSLRGDTAQEISEATTRNAEKLFSI